MKQVTVIGNIKSGKLELVDQKGFREQVAVVFDKDCIVDVTVERYGKNRTNKQNSYLWGVPYKLLSDYTGYTPDEMHEICKHKFLSKHLSVGDESFDIGASTRKLTTVEFKEYVSKIQQWASTLGVVIPDPGEDVLSTLNDGLDLQKVKS